MTIDVTINGDDLDSDVTVTNVSTFQQCHDLTDVVDVYLEDREGHTINLELDPDVAYALWKALGESALTQAEAPEEDETEQPTVVLTPVEDQ